MKRGTLPWLLRDWAQKKGDETLYTFLDHAGEETSSTSYGECLAEAEGLARNLALRAARGERVLILALESQGFVRAFLASQLAGTIAVPAYPPLPMAGGRSIRALNAIIADCRPSIVLSDGGAEQREMFCQAAPALVDLPWLGLDPGSGGAESGPLREVDSAATSFLQYTSGSTSSPKGVVVSHSALLAQEEMLEDCLNSSWEDVVIGWLPLYHDMGLIGNLLHPLWLGARAVLMSPLTFIQSPVRWLRAITQYRGTVAGGPNFGYELCVRRVPEEDLDDIDLGSWRLAFNGAEPVKAGTLESFARRFGPRGFSPAAAYPCYGLAEATLLATGAGPGRGPLCFSADIDALEAGELVEGSGRVLVSSGIARRDRRIEIADPESGRRMPEGSIGEIWVSGRDLACGYWGRPEETAATFDARLAQTADGPFLRTGDLGALRDGQLFVTGRLKDLIIVAGRNHYPQDIETTVEACDPVLRAGCCAACACGEADRESVAVVAELKRGTTLPEDRQAALEEAIRVAVARVHGIRLERVELIPADCLPKTSSGKIQRQACRAIAEQGWHDSAARGLARASEGRG